MPHVTSVVCHVSI